MHYIVLQTCQPVRPVRGMFISETSFLSLFREGLVLKETVSLSQLLHFQNKTSLRPLLLKLSCHPLGTYKEGRLLRQSN